MQERLHVLRVAICKLPIEIANTCRKVDGGIDIIVVIVPHFGEKDWTVSIHAYVRCRVSKVIATCHELPIFVAQMLIEIKGRRV